MKKYFSGRCLLVIVLLTTIAIPCAMAGDYPEKPIQLICPWKAGGGTDALMRLVAHYASNYLEEPMVVVNVPGVTGTRGLKRGADAKPDGYTIVALHESVVCTKLTGVTNYDFKKVVPIANITVTPIIMAAKANAHWNNFAEVIEEAKAKPKTIKVGVTLGGSAHFTLMNISSKSGAKFKVVGYEGTAARQAALVGGYIDLAETSIAAGSSYFKSGQLKALAIASAERHPRLLNVPTFKEQGVDVVFSYNRGLYAPIGTPDRIVKKLEGALKKVSEDSEFKSKIEALGSDVGFKNGDETGRYVDSIDKNYSELYVQITK